MHIIDVIGVFGAKEFILRVIFSLGAVMTSQVVIEKSSRVVMGSKNEVIACDMSKYR